MILHAPPRMSVILTREIQCGGGESRALFLTAPYARNPPDNKDFRKGVGICDHRRVPSIWPSISVDFEAVEGTHQACASFCLRRSRNLSMILGGRSVDISLSTNSNSEWSVP